MGNEQTKLGLRMDKRHFCAGSLATGRVYLSMTQELKADALHLVLVGQEFTTIVGENDAEWIGDSSNEILVHMDVPLT
jgi:hypothetical protein